MSRTDYKPRTYPAVMSEAKYQGLRHAVAMIKRDHPEGHALGTKAAADYVAMIEERGSVYQAVMMFVDFRDAISATVGFDAAYADAALRAFEDEVRVLAHEGLPDLAKRRVGVAYRMSHGLPLRRVTGPPKAVQRYPKAMAPSP